MKYLSVCSGIEAATQAWHPMGWEPVAFSEIEPFPSAVLAHHYPQTPNLGDMTQYEKWNIGTIDLLVGGTPCQSFSVAGLRKGLGDPRGNLMLTFGAIAKRFKPRWVVWENVPGVLSSNGGRDFGTFLGMLAELGYGFAYRILDTQFVRTCRFRGAIPQRRRRVFVVGYFGDWRRAAAVLFDRESLRGNPPPSREAGQGFAADAGSRAQSGSHWDGTGCHPSLNQSHNTGGIAASNQEIFSQRGAGLVSVPPIAETLQTTCNDYSRADGFNAIAFERRFVRTTGGQPQSGANGCLRADTNSGDEAPCVAFGGNVARTLNARHDSSPCADRGMDVVALQTANTKANGKNYNLGGAADTIDQAGPQAVAKEMQVRRLTPIECERLQGFPDDFTRIPWRNKAADDCPDGPRYKALGNSMSVNVMELIGGRIERVENQTFNQQSK